MGDLLIIIACALANRLAGGGLWIGAWWDADLMADRGKRKLPGRAMYPAALGVGMLALAWSLATGGWSGVGVADITLAGLWCATYAFWRSLAHGRWFDLHRLPDGYGRHGPPTIYERAVELFSFESDHIALFIRHLLVFPGLLVIYWFTEEPIYLIAAVPFAFATVCAYELGHRYSSKPILIGELLSGAFFGILIVI